MAVFFIILQRELQIYGKNLNRILANFLFFFISASSFGILLQNQENQSSETFYTIAVIWFSLIFSIIFSSNDFAKKDFEDGTVEQMINSLDHLEIYVLAKSLALLLVNILPIALASAILVKFNISAEIKASEAFALIILTGICANFICCFCGSLSILENSAAMISVIAMPLIIPVMLISFSGITENFSSSIQILLWLSVVIGAMSVLATAKIIKIAAE